MLCSPLDTHSIPSLLLDGTNEPFPASQFHAEIGSSPRGYTTLHPQCLLLLARSRTRELLACLVEEPDRWQQRPTEGRRGKRGRLGEGEGMETAEAGGRSGGERVERSGRYRSQPTSSTQHFVLVLCAKYYLNT